MSDSTLALTDEHRDLAESVTGALNRVKSRAATRATLNGGASSDGEIWNTAAELGWHGLAIGKEYDGSGFGAAELAIVLEAPGHELCPGPFLPTVAAR